MFDLQPAGGPARQFLERVVPWGSGGFVNIHFTVKRDGYDKPIWRGTPCQSIEEAVRAVSYATANKDALDIYVCMSAQSHVKTITKKDGSGSFKVAMKEQANAVSLRALWLDLDVALNNKSGKAYQTTEEALVALVDFVEKSGLPMPNVGVYSGSGGVHIYWVLDTALSPPEWLQLAQALAEATRRFGLLCDTGCTVDSARVLRVPGTKNCKSSPPNPVRLAKLDAHDIPLAQMRMALHPYSGAQVVPFTARGKSPGLNSELTAGIDTGTVGPVDLYAVAKECAFVHEALKTGGEGFSQPLWNLTTLIATFAQDSEDMAHEMANGHAEYDADETQKLYERKLKEKTEKNIGWPSCRTVQNSGCTNCSTCRHLIMNKSPLNHGIVPAAVAQLQAQGLTLSLDDMPNGYLRGNDGTVVKVVPDDTVGEKRLAVCAYPITDGWLQDSPWTLHFMTRLNPKSQVKTAISITLSNLQSKDNCAKTLAAQGMALPKGAAPMLQEFLLSWVTKLQQMKDTVVSASPFGWLVIGGRIDGFAYGGRVWRPGDDKAAASPDPVLAYQYTPKGELQPWLDAADVVTSQNRPATDGILAASFAAPLVRFVGLNGLFVSTYSTESGIGKTTAIDTAQAVWGSPTRAKQALTDTINSVTKKIGELQSLPLFWDELKTEQDTSRFVQLAFQLSGGKDKSRLGADSGLRDVGTWQTLLLSASNDSIVDHITRKTKTTTAGLYRVFEYVVPPAVTPSQFSSGHVSRLVSSLNDNYGQAGLVYARFLGRDHEKIAAEVAKLQDDLVNELNATQDERFWIGTITVLLAGAKYANELGLTTINTFRLKEFLVEKLERMRGDRKMTGVDLTLPMNVSNLLAQYFAASRHDSLLVTNSIYRGFGRPATGSIRLVHSCERVKAARLQIGIDDQVLRMAATPFRTWLENQGMSCHQVFEALTNTFGMIQTQGRLGAGTALSGINEHCLDFDLRVGSLADLDLGINEPANSPTSAAKTTAG